MIKNLLTHSNKSQFTDVILSLIHEEIIEKEFDKLLLVIIIIIIFEFGK